MNNERKAIDTIIDKVMKAVHELTATLPFDKTFPTIVYGKEDNKYQIVFEGRLRGVQSALPCDIQNGTLVWVKIPNGKLREMHICGLRYK